MGVHNKDDASDGLVNDYGVRIRSFPNWVMDSPSPPHAVGRVQQKGLVEEWVEMWDYVGGIRFRGFVAEKDAERALVVFFDQNLAGGLKSGYVGRYPYF